MCLYSRSTLTQDSTRVFTENDNCYISNLGISIDYLGTEGIHLQRNNFTKRSTSLVAMGKNKFAWNSGQNISINKRMYEIESFISTTLTKTHPFLKLQYLQRNQSSNRNVFLLFLKKCEAWRGDWGINIKGFCVEWLCLVVVCFSVNHASKLLHCTSPTNLAKLSWREEGRGLHTGLRGPRSFNSSTAICWQFVFC